MGSDGEKFFGTLCEKIFKNILNVFLTTFFSNCQLFYRTLRLTYSLAGLVSLFFLALSIFCYATLPEFQNMHGRIVTANLSFIFSTTLLLVILYNIESDNSGMSLEEVSILKISISADFFEKNYLFILIYPKIYPKM
jgi:hypothetical protein